ncbi:MAG: Ldh family oxidoreductase [Bifidobacterium minimum]|nr:Ldh family oxidoreductase [Bifidobacterium minimum]
MRDVFLSHGFDDDQSRRIARALGDADLRGISSHGIQRLRMYDDRIRQGLVVPGEEGVVVRDGSASAVMDGRRGMGQLVAEKAMGLAIDKAMSYGVGAVAVRNSNHFGAAGYYANLAADEGLWGFSFTNSNALMAPTHSAIPFLGSNPVAVALRTSHGRIVYDAALTTSSMGRIEVHGKRGSNLPGDWAVDAQGRVVRSPSMVMEGMTHHPRVGALTPLGGIGEDNAGYKGYGLGLVVELVTSVLSGGKVSADVCGGGMGHFFLALDPAFFIGRTEAEYLADNLAARLRGLPSVDGSSVLVPGDKELVAYDRVRVRGVVIDDRTEEELEYVASRCHVRLPWKSRGSRPPVGSSADDGQELER